MRTFLTFAGLQAVAYVVLVSNLRAISSLNYPVAAGTEALYLLIQWTVLRRIVAAEGIAAKLGYITGGTLGTLLAMWLTRGWD